MIRAMYAHLSLMWFLPSQYVYVNVNHDHKKLQLVTNIINIISYDLATSHSHWGSNHFLSLYEFILSQSISFEATRTSCFPKWKRQQISHTCLLFSVNNAWLIQLMIHSYSYIDLLQCIIIYILNYTNSCKNILL